MFKLPLTAAAALLAAASVTHAEVPKVATDIAPVHALAARLMQGLGEPDLVVPPGASPHGYSMRPSEARALAQADLVFWMGEALTPWMHGAMTELAGDARVVELLEVDGTLVLPFRTGVGFEAHGHDAHGGEDHDDHEAEDHSGHDEDHHDEAVEAHEDGHDGHDDHAEHDHAHAEGIDPHAWLAPENGKLWLDVMAAELSRLDPENAAIYAENADAAKVEIEAAEVRVNAELTAFRAQKFVVFHDAYQYFERSFDLQASGAIALGDASDPSPARIAEIQQVVAQNGVTCVFSEPQFNPDLVTTVLDGSAAKTVVLDPVGAHLKPGAGFYTALLEDLGAAMASCH
ncbi:zinc ABC transporter substrate-binding protein [Pseudophaeobacter sp.]|uniref:zinc ABC transporter substrate-binding protein n=1 Tax=Pseudophaeobacter sp. TaxID=1971739 RepID=UPI0032984236